MDDIAPQTEPVGQPLKRGWTTGACATAATRSALTALFTGEFADPVTIRLPGGQEPAFGLAHEAIGETWAEAGIVKDAGDDPDVTHGATIVARVARTAAGDGISFHAGHGVGTVTKPGLPIGVGEPAINPVPRRMMCEQVAQICKQFGVPLDIAITISVPNGENIAIKTWNPRLGIVGGISILGTTGIVIPYSCSAWIHSIHSGIDVARAIGLDHVVGATGDTSERAARAHLGLANEAFIDMGDFVGGMLKYLRKNPVDRVTIAGGFAKISKLAQGALDLHSARSTVDLDRLADMLATIGANDKLIAAARNANTANQVHELARSAGLPLAQMIAEIARQTAQSALRDANCKVDILVVDRSGNIVAEAR